MGHLKNESLRSYLDRELSGKKRIRAERHLADCAACREKLQTVRAAADQVRVVLDLLAPNSVPAPATFIARDHKKAGSAGSNFRRFVFSPIPVPSILLMLMASVILVLSGMLYVEKHRGGTNKKSPVVEARREYLTVSSPNGLESIRFDFSLKQFQVGKNPIIMVMKEKAL